MAITIFKKTNAQREQIDIQTGYSLWSLLVARYESLESAQMFRNFAHDKDLEIAMNMLIRVFKAQIDTLEKEIENLQLLAPTRPAAEIITSVRVDEISDRFIYKRTTTDMLVELFSISRAVRTSLTSDRLRSIFTGFFNGHLNLHEELYKYGRLKGWVDIAPAYKTTAPQEREQLSVSDAFHLWDHIQKRYQQLELTMLFEGIAHDMDFRLAMASASNTLKDQLNLLEQLAVDFEVTLPERPPSSMKFAIDPEPMQDRFLFRQVFVGVENMLDGHIRASIEILRNDRLRKIFTNFLRVELDIHDSMIKYGKLKGWLVVPPLYAQGTVG